MADSDEEYDRRKGRDKFRRERSDYQERREERGRRDDWPERDRSSRRDYRDYDPRSRRDRYSPPRHDMSPPAKRVRREWIPRDERGYGNYDAGYPGGGAVAHRGWGAAEMGGMAAQHGYGSHQGPQRAEMEPGLTQPPMMTFKQFLASQDDGIDDQEAVKKYKEYKLEFKRQQINDFFLNHKEEEWFKSKYHPEECGKRRADQLTALRRRLDVYLELLDKGWVDAVSIDVEKSDQIVRLLDAVVIKLEGGTDFDLKSLDENFEEGKPKEPEVPQPVKEEMKKEEKEGEEEEEDAEGEEEDEKEESKEDQKRKRPRNFGYDENEDSSADSDSESEPAAPGIEDDGDSGVNADEPMEEKKKKKKRKTKDSESRSEHDDSLDKEDEDEVSGEQKEGKSHTKGESSTSEGEKTSGKNSEKAPSEEGEEKEVKEEDNSPPKPRSFHKTCSIFLRNLAPTITKQEVEAMCRRYPGFLRVAIADPQPERRFFRRGWVTFERSVNIKEICWNLNNIRLRDCELGAIVNRDLSRRIRSINGIASDKQVVRSDIKLAARIIQNLDNQKRLWSSEEQEIDQNYQSYGLASKNPLLKNITDYLIEEASAEEEELLGMASQDETKEREEVGSTLERDETLIKVLDRLLVYLRVVHSVDYYNHSEYPNEDEMPNRCGIMHARGSPPSSKVTQKEINEYIANFEMKSIHFLQPQAKVTEDEAEKLGRKDPEAEVEKFVQANTQELAKDKWLCPLSGKKFKGPEFVRKHIFNKHSEKVEEVRREVEYFNNYLMDPKRPQLPEHPSNRTNMGGSSGAGGAVRGDGYGGMAPYHNSPGFPPPFGGFSGHRGGMAGPGFQGYPASGYGNRNNFPDMYNRSGGFGRRNFGRNPRFDSRKLLSYRDLDAPSEQDVI